MRHIDWTDVYALDQQYTSVCTKESLTWHCLWVASVTSSSMGIVGGDLRYFLCTTLNTKVGTHPVACQLSHSYGRTQRKQKLNESPGREADITVTTLSSNRVPFINLDCDINKYIQIYPRPGVTCMETYCCGPLVQGSMERQEEAQSKKHHKRIINTIQITTDTLSESTVGEQLSNECTSGETR